MMDRNDRTVHAPHAPLPRYYGDEENRSKWVRKMFDDTASDYDHVDRIAALGSGPRYRGQALLRAGLAPGMSALDVGVGTGLVASQAARIVRDPNLIIGIDPSPGMLKYARVPPGVKLVEGLAERIPLLDRSVDFLSMGYALRHVSDLAEAFSEFFRVLKPRGRLCILEITAPNGTVRTALLKSYLRGVVPILARLSTRHLKTATLWSYYWDTIAACVSPERVIHTLESAGFVSVNRHVELGIFSEYRAEKPSGTAPC